MCGLFGFISKTGRPDLGRLRAIALETERRGTDAFGLAWIGSDGRLQTFKRPGAISKHLHELDRCREARVLVGHCRYATHGHPSDNDNNHPHRVGRGGSSTTGSFAITGRSPNATPWSPPPRATAKFLDS